MTKYGIIGFPLTNSFSKQYFNNKIDKEAIANAHYENFPLNSIEEFPQLIKANPELKGLSVTIPYKETVLQYINNFSDEVKKIGATNCIRIKNRKLTAFNTDIIGFEKSFIKLLQPVHKKALVLGTGGASKAVQYVLHKLGIDYLVVSRNKSIQKNFIQYNEITATIIDEHKIIINCTPLGMAPAVNTCPNIPYALLTANHYLYDLVYKPETTLFLQKGEQKGANTCNGFEMLVLQAEENWRIWNEE